MSIESMIRQEEDAWREDWAMQQAQDERDELKRVAMSFEHIENVIRAIEKHFPGMELTSVWEDIEHLKQALAKKLEDK